MNQAIEFNRVADIYDEYVQTTLDIPFFLNEVKKTTGEILELMSGTGRVSLPLIEAGAKLTCTDYSEQMLNVLKNKLQQRQLSAPVHQMDVRELRFDQTFDLILLPFNSFSELLTPEDQQRTLQGIYHHLADQGRFICTLHNPAIRLKNVDQQLRLWGKYPRANGTLLLWGAEQYAAEQQIVNGVQLFEEYDQAGKLAVKRLLEIRFRIVEKQELEAMAASVGLRVDALYGDYSYHSFEETTSPFMIWVFAKI